MSQTQTKSKVQWGTILAGAAIAVGVVMVAPWVPEAVIGTLSSIGSALSGLVTGIVGAFTPVAGAAPEVAAASGMSDLTKEALMKFGGVALAAIGVTHLLSRKTEVHEPHHHHDRGPSQSFAAKEDMRKMQALMQVRMAAAGAPAAGMGIG